MTPYSLHEPPPALQPLRRGDSCDAVRVGLVHQHHVEAPIGKVAEHPQETVQSGVLHSNDNMGFAAGSPVRSEAIHKNHPGRTLQHAALVRSGSWKRSGPCSSCPLFRKP